MGLNFKRLNPKEKKKEKHNVGEILLFIWVMFLLLCVIGCIIFGFVKFFIWITAAFSITGRIFCIGALAAILLGITAACID